MCASGRRAAPLAFRRLTDPTEHPPDKQGGVTGRTHWGGRGSAGARLPASETPLLRTQNIHKRTKSVSLFLRGRREYWCKFNMATAKLPPIKLGNDAMPKSYLMHCYITFFFDLQNTPIGRAKRAIYGRSRPLTLVEKSLQKCEHRDGVITCEFSSR